MGVFITPIRALFRVGSPEGSLPFFRGEDFSGFFLEPFPRVITAAVIIITAITITTATFIIIATAAIITANVIAIGGIPIRVKAPLFGEIF